MTTGESLTEHDVVIVEADQLIADVVMALVFHGANREDAQIQATILVESELRGHASHGVRRLPILLARLDAGLISSGIEPEWNWVTETFLKVDGRGGFGPVVAQATIDRLLERSLTTGVALAAIADSNHVGMLSPYLERIAGAGQIGFALTTSEALVHAWGGDSAVVGTNPVGIAVPLDDEPLILDMSTAAVSMGKILDHRERGLPIPNGWAVDHAGKPTTNAAAAAEGAVSPFGGPKGYALGIALEAVVATLTQTALGTRVRGTLDSEHPATKGDVFVCLSPESLGIQGDGDSLRAYFNEVRASGSGRGPMIPGERARAIREERLATGIPLHRSLHLQIQKLREGEAIDA